MKKFLCLVIALVLCLSIAVPAFAAASEFVPSITYKPEPIIVPVEKDGVEYAGVMLDENGEILDYVEHACILITPLGDIWDAQANVPTEIKELLEKVHEGLTSGELEINCEKHDSDKMVVRDLFDVRLVCDEHPVMLEEGAVLELTFDLGVNADDEVCVSVYDDESGEWTTMDVVNNGDGSVTVAFTSLGVVAFSVLVD